VATHNSSAFRVLIRSLLIVVSCGFLSSIFADVSGSWNFAVDLGQLGSGNAAVTLSQDADGRLSGSYSGQLGQTSVSGSWEGDDFQFSFASELLGGDITYRGSMQENGTLTGAVVIQGQEAGTFTGTRQ